MGGELKLLLPVEMLLWLKPFCDMQRQHVGCMVLQVLKLRPRFFQYGKLSTSSSLYKACLLLDLSRRPVCGCSRNTGMSPDRFL